MYITPPSFTSTSAKMAVNLLRFFALSTLSCLIFHHPAANASEGFLRRGTPEEFRYSDAGEGFIRLNVSEKGLIYAKDLLVAQALETLIPLHIPDIKKSLDLGLLGSAFAILSHITLTNITVPFSGVRPGKDGIGIIASDVGAILTLKWRISYMHWFLPVTLSEKGDALVKVKGMEAGVTLGLGNQNGTLNLIPMHCRTSVKDIVITLEGGAAWVFQGIVHAFEGQIRAAVESTVTAKIVGGITKLDSLLHGLPKEILFDHVAALNVTIMQAPVVGPTSISIGIDGLFVPLSSSDVFVHLVYGLQPWVSCAGPSKMLEIALNEAVLNSAAAAYYNAGFLNWLVDKLPDQALLNTASWKWIIPKLYSRYPDDDMILNISLPSPPIITVTVDGIQAVVVTDMIIDVVDHNDTIPVAGISLGVVAYGTVDMSGNNITGVVGLSDLTLKLKWSNVGSFHMDIIQAIMRTLVKDIILPLVNLHLKRGFPLPIFQNFNIRNADILYCQSWIVVCTDVQYISDLSK